MTVQTHRRLACCGLVAWCLGVGTAWADPPLSPLPDPLFSFDLSSPAVQGGVVAGGDLLEVAFPEPGVFLGGDELSLIPILDDIDALSASNPGLGATVQFTLLFSVDRNTTGVVPPATELINSGVPYNVVDQVQRGHAPGDQFLSTALYDRLGLIDAGTSNNVLVRNNFDEGGEDFAAYPATHADTQLTGTIPLDNVDATVRWSAGDVATELLFFSLTATSPSLDGLPGPASGANLYVVDPLVTATGACCLGEAACDTAVTLEECAIMDGLWRGPGTTCDACSNSGRIGGCCLPEDECAELSEFDCVLVGGLPVGPGLPCDVCVDPFFEVTCCHPDGTCSVEHELDCLFGEGVPVGPDVPCVVCGEIFADAPCCFGDGSCTVLGVVQCQNAGGLWMGPGAECEMCEAGFEVGACCREEGCTITNVFECFETNGFHLGPDSSCDGCTGGGSEGACCRFDGACSIESDLTCAESGGLPLGPQAPCELCDNFFPVAPCCLPGGGCEIIDEPTCASIGGQWTGPAATCDACAVPPGNPACRSKADDCAPAVDRRHNGAGSGLTGVYATFFELGLQPTDDIDALVVFDQGVTGVFDADDTVLFSLKPGSPSLLTLPGASPGGAGADIFVATVEGGPTLFATAAQLGLGAAGDNIDALDFQVPLPTLTTGSQPAVQHGIRGPILRKRSELRRRRGDQIRNGGGG